MASPLPARGFGLACAAALLLVSGCATSSGLSSHLSEPVALAATVEPVDVAAFEARYPDADGVILSEEVTLEHEYQAAGFAAPAAWMYYEDSRTSYVVLDTDDETLTTFEFAMPPGAALVGVLARVTRPDGTADVFTVEDLAEETDDGGTTYKLAYPNVERGSLIEEAYRLQHDSRLSRPPLRYDIPLQFGVPCERLAFRFVMPKSWQVRVKDIAPDRKVPYTVRLTPDGKKTILAYTATDLPAIRDEIYAPLFKERAAYLEFDVASITLGTTRVYDAPSEWSALADDIKRYVFRKGGFFSNPARRQAEALVDDAMTPEARLDAVVAWARDHLDVGSPDNDSFTDVLEDGEGNPYIITGLVQAVLEEAGLEAEYLLIHSARDGHFDPDFVTMAQLYIPALGVVLPGGVRRFVFPYLDGLSTDHVPEPFQGQRAMRIDGDGFQGFLDVPYGNTADNTAEERYVVTLREDGLLDVEEERTVRGSLAYMLRSGLEDLAGEERDAFVEELLTYTDGEVLDLTYAIENEDAAEAPLVIRLAYTVDNLVTLTPEEVLFQTGGLLTPASRVSRKVDTRERQSAVRIYNDETFVKSIEVNYPAAWRLVTPLAEAAVANEFGELRGTYTVDAGTLTIEQRTDLRRAEAPPETFDTLLALVGARSQLAVPTLVFSTAPAE